MPLAERRGGGSSSSLARPRQTFKARLQVMSKRLLDKNKHQKSFSLAPPPC
jgi:hypothetical protein